MSDTTENLGELNVIEDIPAYPNTPLASTPIVESKYPSAQGNKINSMVHEGTIINQKDIEYVIPIIENGQFTVKVFSLSGKSFTMAETEFMKKEVQGFFRFTTAEGPIFIQEDALMFGILENNKFKVTTVKNKTFVAEIPEPDNEIVEHIYEGVYINPEYIGTTYPSENGCEIYMLNGKHITFTDVDYVYHMASIK